jgi:hypothetical protein
MLNPPRLQFFIILSVVFIFFPVVCILQGSPGDTSSDPEMVGFVTGLFYRPLVGGDEAWWDYASSLLFTHNPFDVKPLSLLIGYINLGESWGSSSLYILYLFLLKAIFRNPYLVVAAKGFIDLGFILWIYRNSCDDFIKTRAVQPKIASIACIIVLFSPFFWWWAFSYLRDDIMVVLSCYLLILYSKKSAAIILGRRYCFTLLALCLIFLNIKLYSLVLPVVLLFCHLFRSRNVYLLSIRKLILLLILVGFAFLLLPVFVRFLSGGIGLGSLVLTMITSFFKPLPTNILSIPMGEAQPFTVVYLFNWLAVSFTFLCILLILLLRPFGAAKSVYHIFPLVSADLMYRLILSSFDGHILGVRQCITVLPFELYISIYLLSRHFVSSGRFNPKKLFTATSSP